jgi:DNA-binding transcriptional ArsR family regulator
MLPERTVVEAGVSRRKGLDMIPYFANDLIMNRVFKALSDPTRRRVLQLLRERPMTAGELADHFDLAKPTMSAHFAVLREADLIDAEKSGTTITYRLKMSVLEDALLGFAETFGLELEHGRRGRASRRPATRGVAS